MSVNYERPAFAGHHFKPPRGSLRLAKEKDDAEAAKIERREKAKVRKRDPRCRWPEAHTCRGRLECSHIKHASVGGDMSAKNMARLCLWLHQIGPETIHGGALKIECETAAGADGPLSFWRKNIAGEWYLVARETAPFVIEKD